MTFSLADLDALLAKMAPPPGPRATTIRMHPTAWVVIKASAEERPSWRGMGWDWGLPVFEDDELPLLGWEIRDQDGKIMTSGNLLPTLPPYELPPSHSIVGPYMTDLSVTRP